MKKTRLTVFFLALALVLAGTAAWAQTTPTITIDDSGEGNPGVTTSGFTQDPYVTPDNESATISATLTSNFLTAGKYGMVMRENPADPDYFISQYQDISDLAILTVDPDNETQSITLAFYSDGYTNFTDVVDQYLLEKQDGRITEVFNQIETQDYMTLFDKPGLKIEALSPSTVPLPPSVWLLGSSLLGLVGLRKVRKI